mmetsp:Transcript_86106/g.171985  ORF Transcript_86106/g.171985 Transcript_86106/m.171985 type:complete len:96 (-) Transcript_86106:520-807(-)
MTLTTLVRTTRESLRDNASRYFMVVGSCSPGSWSIVVKMYTRVDDVPQQPRPLDDAPRLSLRPALPRRPATSLATAFAFASPSAGPPAEAHCRGI